MSTVVVAGITRSGLSLTMQMLWAGGYPCKGDPPAFECFPLGTIPWSECDGYAVKLVDAHLQLPPTGDYLVIRLCRDMREQARSFNKWNAVFGLPSVAPSRLIGSFRRDYATIDAWAKSQRGWMLLDFDELIAQPHPRACAIAEFLDADLDTHKMASVVVGREPHCFDGILEERLIREYEAVVAVQKGTES